MYLYHKEHGIHYAITDNEVEECKKNGWEAIADYQKWHNEQIAKKLGKTIEKEEKTLDKEENAATIVIQADPQKRTPGRPKKPPKI